MYVETRGLFRKNEVREELARGDCIGLQDLCSCWSYGIDIRNGTYLNVWNCTARIDALITRWKV
ncbi:MAG: hypothetical protein IPF95_18050 [Flavobacteriales bacterium]|nr:hypothetical protein [Flavobacteriales bacterium]